MMTQRPSPAGDEGNLVGGVTRPRPKASFASPFTKPAFWLNWTAGPTKLGGLEPPTPAHAVFAAASSCLSREERLAVLVTTPVPVVVVGATVWVLVHAARASVRTTGTRARNLTGAMLPRSRDGMVPRKDIDVQLLATKQW